MVGVAADKAALVHDYLAERRRRGASPPRSTSSARLPHQDLLDFGRLAELLGYDRKLNTLDYPGLAARLPDPRAHPAPAEARRRSSIVERVRRPRRAARRRPTRSSRPSRASARSARRTSARAFAGCRRSTSWTATCRPEQAGRPAGRPRTKEDTIPHEQLKSTLTRTSRSTVEVEHIEFELGDNVVYPHHGAGKVLKKEAEGGARRGARVPHDQDPSQRHDRHGPVARTPRMAGLRRVIDEETVKKVLAVLAGRRLGDAEELEPPLQAQPRQDQDRRHLRARRGRAQPRHPRAREGPLDRREADVHAGQEDPRLRADVRARHGRGRGRGAPRRPARRRPRAARSRSRPSSPAEHRDGGRADRGRRAWRAPWGRSGPKALVVLAGRPMLEWSVAALRAVDGDRARSSSRCPPGAATPRRRARSRVAGGAERSHSVRAALAAARGGPATIRCSSTTPRARC